MVKDHSNGIDSLTVFTIETLIFVVLVALLSALCGVAAFAIIARSGPKQTARDLIRGAEQSIVFLFDDEELVDATERAHAMLKSRPKGSSQWRQFCAIAQARFPDLPLEMAQLATEGALKISSNDPSDHAQIHAEWWNGVARIELVEDVTVAKETVVDPHSMSAMNSELETLRRTAEMSPYLIWQQTSEGVITWANSTYFKLAQDFEQNADDVVHTWPPARLFESVSLSQGSPEGRSHRVSVKFPSETSERWYEVFSTTVGSESLHFATNADGVVRAETALREFVQTLTKTFAHLPTGLAIFDKKRQLALFNPALTNLTGLQPMFLSIRPTLFSFLDKLREAQVIPEPKDYKSWRSQMNELEAAAVGGTYSETWSLPSGQTYRVTGRPHPDGAVAFLFEDISSEVSLTRRFRSELEVGQAVLDTLSEAFAVFGPNGMFTMSNAPYTELWDFDPESSVSEISITDAISLWRSKCEPNDIWNTILEYAALQGERTERQFKIRLLDGRMLPGRITPIAGGGTLIAFSLVSSETSHPLKASHEKSNDIRREKGKDALLFKIEA